MTQIELSKNIGIARTALSEMLSGKRTVGPKSAKKIAVYLGLPDEWRRYVEIPSLQLKRLLCHKKENTRKSDRTQQ